MLTHDAHHPHDVDLRWSQVTSFLLAVGRQVELQDEHGNSFVVLTRRRYDALRAAADANAGTVPPGPGTAPVPTPTLTERERQCLRLVSRGLSTAGVARELGLAQNTVAQHLASARRQYGVRSSLAAAAAARAQGVID